jgi:hypothetical protein
MRNFPAWCGSNQDSSHATFWRLSNCLQNGRPASAAKPCSYGPATVGQSETVPGLFSRNCHK